jgi:transcriptional regulator with GAF, ATPase, and Fis domain
MNSTATWEREEPETVVQPVQNNESSTSTSSINTMKQLALQLLCELQCVDEINASIIGSGFDFYEEVSRFETDLIKRALLQTGGHQVRAAKLLNLKVTTLNSKIKHYNISLTGFTNVYPVIDANKLVERQHV